MEKNELKNIQEGLEKSIEKLQRKLSYLECRMNSDSWRTPEIMQRDMTEWELERRKRELAVLDWLIEINKPITLEFDGSNKDYFEIYGTEEERERNRRIFERDLGKRSTIDMI